MDRRRLVARLDNISTTIGGDIQSEDPGALDVFFLAGKTILSVPKTVFSSIGIVTSLLGSQNLFVQKLGIPPIFVNAFLVIFTIGIAFLIINLWARWKT